MKNEFEIPFDNYKIKMSKELIEKYKTPYEIDRLISVAFEKQGSIPRIDLHNSGDAPSLG